MTTTVTWLGHGSWSIKTENGTILLDPFLDDSPTAPVKAADVEADYILVSHGHFDHVADVAAIANRTGATVAAVVEIGQWFQDQHGVENTIQMNLGGGITLPFGHLKMTLAHHSSQLPDGTYGGNPAGFLLTIEGKKIYFACDTALFLDMQQIGDVGLDVAVLPIGDLFTMGPADAVKAVQLLRPNRVVPAHYNTWPPIEQDAGQWATLVHQETEAEPLVLQPGESFEL